MSFTRSTRPVIFQYQLEGNNISRYQSVKDLGIIFDTKLTFHDHVQALVSDCFRKLGFVTRNCKDFTSMNVIKLLYTTLVRSKLEAGACIWNPHESSYTLLIEKVQKRFLRFLYKKMFGYYPFMYPTKFLQGTLAINSLETRRLYFQILTVVDILGGRLNSPELLGEASRLSVPEQRIRFRSGAVPLFAPAPARTAARQQSPMFRAQRHLNGMLGVSHPHLDIFADGRSKIGNACLSYCEEVTTSQNN